MSRPALAQLLLATLELAGQRGLPSGRRCPEVVGKIGDHATAVRDLVQKAEREAALEVGEGELDVRPGSWIATKPLTRVRSNSLLPEPTAPTTSPCGPVPAIGRLLEIEDERGAVPRSTANGTRSSADDGCSRQEPAAPGWALPLRRPQQPGIGKDAPRAGRPDGRCRRARPGWSRRAVASVRARRDSRSALHRVEGDRREDPGCRRGSEPAEGTLPGPPTVITAVVSVGGKRTGVADSEDGDADLGSPGEGLRERSSAPQLGEGIEPGRRRSPPRREDLVRPVPGALLEHPAAAA